MYKTTADPNRVLVWQHENTTPGLIEIARSGRLHEIEPVPVFELAKQYQEFGDYVLFEGHHRREAARRAGSLLPLIVVECAEDFQYVKELEEPIWTRFTAKYFREFYLTNLECALEYLGYPIQFDRQGSAMNLYLPENLGMPKTL